MNHVTNIENAIRKTWEGEKADGTLIRITQFLDR